MQDNKENEHEEKISNIEDSEIEEAVKVEEIKEDVKEEIVVEENITNKDLNLTLKENDFFETASEIKFNSMFLDYFPIKYRNFSKMFVPLKIMK